VLETKLTRFQIQFGLDNPRRIKHHPLLKVFGVACNRTEPVRIGEPENIRSSFRLLDDTTFNHYSQWNCEADEEITSVEVLTTGTEPKGFFCVGTTCFGDSSKEPSEGRLVIFSAHKSDARSPHLSKPQLSVSTSDRVNGAVCAIAIVNEFIVAAVNASIVVFRFELLNDLFSLHRVTHWTHSYFLTSLVSHGTTLVAGDAISSVCLLKLEDLTLKCVARDYGPLWPVCVEALSDESIIGANTDHNLFSFELQRSEIQTILDRSGGYHIGDKVTKFVPGTLASHKLTSDLPLEPKQLFFTASGRIGVVVNMGNELALNMIGLQRNMASIIKGASSNSHTKYRAPKNARNQREADASSFGFLDGDFLERFLSLSSSPKTTERILRGQSEAERLSATPEELQKVLEMLQGMH
jgi:DNA damage-binding protein 1